MLIDIHVYDKTERTVYSSSNSSAKNYEIEKYPMRDKTKISVEIQANISKVIDHCITYSCVVLSNHRACANHTL